jgi:hypothetical protein
MSNRKKRENGRKERGIQPQKAEYIGKKRPLKSAKDG